MKDKHKAPLWCRVRSIFFFSPSAVFAKCILGLKKGCKACKNCENNVREIMFEGFQEGLSKGQRLEIENFINKKFQVPTDLKEELTKCNT